MSDILFYFILTIIAIVLISVVYDKWVLPREGAILKTVDRVAYKLGFMPMPFDRICPGCGLAMFPCEQTTHCADCMHGPEALFDPNVV